VDRSLRDWSRVGIEGIGPQSESLGNTFNLSIFEDLGRVIYLVLFIVSV
jgi:hypothetical protein